MRHARRLIATLIGCATWCVAATSVAYAKPMPDPAVVAPPSSSDPGTPLWVVIATAALGVLLAVAVVGLAYSLRHSRRSEPSRRLHA